MKYIRYVVGWRFENPWELTGVFTEASLRGKSFFDKQDQKTINKCFKWFNKNIPVPPFKKWKVNYDAVSWFDAKKSKECIKNLQPLIKTLRQNGLMVRTIKSNRPGKIIYRDDYQVVAITPKCKFK